ncbi:uncharacterized protein LOC111129749 [Crassostrea virginica]
MATASKIEDKLINEVNLCSVCLEQYKLPVTLPCNHSFRQTCLEAHIKSSCVNLDPALGFPCPLCRLFIPAPGRIGQYSLDLWPTKFPENKLLSSLIEKGLLYCKPCQRDEEEVIADSWCQDCSEALCNTCEKCHKKLRPTCHHVVVSVTDLSVSSKKPYQQSLEMCEAHDGQQTIQEKKANMGAIDDMTEKFSNELSELSAAIIQTVKRLEEKHLDELSKLSKESKSKIQQSVDSMEQRLLYLLYWKDILMKNKSRQETAHAKRLLSCSRMKKICEDLKSLNYSKIEIRVQGKLLENAQKLKNVTCLAELISNEHLKPVNEKKISGSPYGVCAIGENEVLVTLSDEKKVLRLDSDSLEIKDTVSLECGSYGIATSGNITVIGTRGSVVMFSGGLEERRYTTISSDLSVTDDVALDDENNVIYSSYSQDTIRKQDKAGNVLFSYTHEKLIKPYGLDVNRNGEIFVGGHDSNNIHILSRSGELLRILEGIENPTWVKFQSDTNRLFFKESSNLKVFQFTAP